ncbi:endonuclease/exonuclease/phosphatase family protein [Erythrobacter sp. JK5]|uniref:endonuclease/exonuclease/phosphatase family protein n=1 Tax=Erythrobacter sp. JK5 TaxID=2829500 RepID=UPI001BA9B483|nr:endonuclease/exonuclease/phosphatase family protein [Erythrobacter sp. JK5]QUL36481.1 endonuclease/exonuclease/phosphatase family protein [Erythrobacter sp. JK5]
MIRLGQFLFALGVIALLAVLVSLIDTDWWLVRAVDLVREPMTYVMLVLLATGLAFARKYRGWIAATFGTAALVNTVCIWPYSTFAATELDLVDGTRDEQCFTAMSANVLMDNPDYAGMIAQIEQVDPDVLLLTETNAEWIEELRPLTARYPHVREHPQEDTFGKVFASRIAVADTDVVEREGEDTPTIYALLRASDADLVRFIGLHPKAPLPGQDTDERDRSILRAADEAQGSIAGGIVMGDFNDVPWSSTTEAFRERGEWRDPRVGRGTYPTFPSNLLPIGWPLDQIMVTGEVEIAAFEILPDNGSDHRAIYGRFCLPRPVNRIGNGAD